jgi:hypothetical protein
LRFEPCAAMITSSSSEKTGKSWAWLLFWVFVPALICYLLSTGPVCRWSWTKARKLYRPINWLGTSKAGGPLLSKWLTIWGAVPWWSQKPVVGSLQTFPAPKRQFDGAVQQFSLMQVSSADPVIAYLGPDISSLRVAAESGDARAQLKLGMLLYNGNRGAATNLMEAYKWALVAKLNGQPEAKYLVQEMELFLPPAEISNGKAAALLCTNAPAAGYHSPQGTTITR